MSCVVESRPGVRVRVTQNGLDTGKTLSSLTGSSGTRPQNPVIFGRSTIINLKWLLTAVTARLGRHSSRLPL